MKRNVLLAVALFATMTIGAQNIAVVSPNNETTMYQTLDDAVTNAEGGSIIYLPGGGVQIKDETKIDKKLTIMGVSHRGDADNADGATIIAGRLNFLGGSSGSAVIGAYISGNIDVGDNQDSVANLTVRFCNVNSIQVHNGKSSGMVVNQSYLRENSNFGGCNVRLENNILHSVQQINGGIINHNVITSKIATSYWAGKPTSHSSFNQVSNTSITNNFITDFANTGMGACYISSNCIGDNPWEQDESPINLDENKKFDDIFKDNKGVKASSNYHLKDGIDKSKFIGSDGTEIGIYGGSSFSDDKSLAPIPRIVSKEVDEQTDGSGRLTIKVTVKSN